mmetsp:Transcript_19058/g.50579  ORF Transcript_19058/g.50579 Transcript_19058/m.50579 type:complete len:270 (-) Transcript_19058:747-1556(-)
MHRARGAVSEALEGPQPAAHGKPKLRPEPVALWDDAPAMAIELHVRAELAPVGPEEVPRRLHREPEAAYPRGEDAGRLSAVPLADRRVKLRHHRFEVGEVGVLEGAGPVVDLELVDVERELAAGARSPRHVHGGARHAPVEGDSCAARPGAAPVALRVQQRLELLEAARGGEARVPLRVLPQALCHGVSYGLGALVALDRGVARRLPRGRRLRSCSLRSCGGLLRRGFRGFCGALRGLCILLRRRLLIGRRGLRILLRNLLLGRRRRVC